MILHYYSTKTELYDKILFNNSESKTKNTCLIHYFIQLSLINLFIKVIFSLHSKMDVDNKNTLDIFSEEFLRCDICQEQLNTPKELPCLHYFCCDCLKGLVRASGLASGGVFACPTCRGEATVPEGGVKAFPTNFHVVRLEKMIKVSLLS